MLFFVVFVWVSTLFLFWRVWRNWKRVPAGAKGLDYFSFGLDILAAVMFLAFSCKITYFTVQGEQHDRTAGAIREAGKHPGPELERALQAVSPSERESWRRALMLKAMRDKELEPVRYFLDQGMKPEQVNDEGRPWITEAMHSSPEIRALLISRCTDPNVCEPQGNRPILLTAVVKNDAESVRLLMAKGADPNKKDGNGDSALSLARRIRPSLVPLLEPKK
ncbi:MAG: hypothetical protein J0I12_20885 [Candidatus Eremiobacteraeota bacterium]|nr:hypothetical protein [Candidatus Eremiobacteraeota bacterium]